MVSLKGILRTEKYNNQKKLKKLKKKKRKEKVIQTTFFKRNSCKEKSENKICHA
jgi:hypothetical protein